MRRSLPLVSAVAALAAWGCAAPPPGPVADASTALVSDRSGVAPRWRAGAAASAEEEARVRGLLGEPLSERAAVDVALVRSRRLQGAIERAISQAMAARADAAPGNPVADLVVRWPHGGGGPVIDAGLAVGLLEFLRLSGRGDAADLESRSAALEAAGEIVGAIQEVRGAWFEAVAARERAALDGTVSEAASIAAELAGRQLEAGTLPRIDADRHRVFRDEALLARDRSRLDAAAAAERLVRALGVFGEEAALRIPDGLPPLPAVETAAGDAESRAVARRLDLEHARAAVVAARLAAGLAADERILPDLEVGVSHERESDGDRSTGPSLSVPLPLSSREAARSASALAAARAAEDELHDLAVRVRSEARESAAAVSTARAIADRYRLEIVPRRVAMVEEAQLLYNGMLIGVYDLLAEKRDELNARREMVDALREYWKARLRLDEALGGGMVPGPAAPAPGDGTEKRDGDAGSDGGHRHGGGR